MKSLKKPRRLPRATPAPEGKLTRAYQVERHLRKFCSVTSHELGNVLGAILGELDFGLSSPDTESQKKAMSLALQAAERALALSRNLRYFAVHTRVAMQPADVSQALLDAIDIVEKDLEAQNIRLAVFVEASTCAHIDSAAFQQIILNLLSNAAHAMPTGGKLTLTLRQTQSHIEITIGDTGPGIAPAHLDQVFEPYFFAHARPSLENLGLGLTVAKALVEAHGGDITVKSQESEGTTFHLQLPADPTLVKPTAWAEKRKFRRVSVTLPVEVETETETWRTDIVTLSTAGAFALIPEKRATTAPLKDSIIGLRIYYYGNAFIEIGKARVVSVCRMGAHAGLGLQFIDIGVKAKKLLSAIVRSHSS